MILPFGMLPTEEKDAKALLGSEEDYTLVDGLLYHIFTASGRKPQTASAQLAVPQNLKKQVYNPTMIGSLVDIWVLPE